MQVMFKLFVLIMMSLTMSLALANEIAGVQGEGRNTQLPPAYPSWSDHPVQKSTVPAPPSGPYMSTGLSNTGQGFACCKSRNAKRMASAPLLNNMPWPERRRPPQQWMPENGQYNYAPGNVGAPRSAPVKWPVQQGWYGGAPMYGQRPAWQPMRQPMQQRPPQVRTR